MSSPQPAFRLPDKQLVLDKKDASAEKEFKYSEITRCLCAAAYMDSNFRHQVIKQCIEEKHKAIGPCIGMDLVTVARHCLIAERKLNKRDLLLCALMVFGLIVAAAADPGPAMAIWILIVPVTFGLCLWQDLRIRSIVSKNFRQGTFDPNSLFGAEERDFSSLADSQNGNAVIYSGFSPFVGSGVDLNGWSFALNSNKGSEVLEVRHEPKPFEINELYEHVEQDIKQLQLQRVSIEDRIYVNGQDIRNDRRFLETPLSKPRVSVDPQILKSAVEQSSQQVRHYRCIRIVDWSGELVLSIFLRFSKLSHNLFVEANYFVLGPLYERYRAVDSIPAHLSLKKWLELLVKSAVASPFLLILSPFIILGRLLQGVARWSERRQERKNILENPAFDYGAGFSIRQWTSSGFYRRYFQKLDKEMYLKTLEKNILDSIVTFLEQRNIDVSEVKQRQTTILNSGVMMTGGSINAESLAVGEKAKSVASRVTDAASKALTTAAGKR